MLHKQQALWQDPAAPPGAGKVADEALRADRMALPSPALTHP